MQLARERNRILRELASEKKQTFMESFVGETVEVITLKEFDGTRTEALTDNYLKLRLKGKHEPNRWLRAAVERLDGDTLVGIVPASPVPIQ